MPSGSCERLTDLPTVARSILDDARRGAFATVDADGRPHVVPDCFATRGDELISGIDHKPKRGKVMARVRHLEADPRATLMADRWDEDWQKVGMGHGAWDGSARTARQRRILKRALSAVGHAGS